MFTGIIKGKGIIVAVKDSVSFRNYTVEFPDKLLIGLEIGASVANNGCCLTVTNINSNKVSFDLIEETLKLTNLGSLKPDDMVNLERSIKYGDEIGGHIMSGHITTLAKIIKILKTKNNLQIWFLMHKKQFMKYILYKGFIGIDGISLTVGRIVNNCFCVNLIPETIARTTVGAKHLGSKVNIEIDTNTQVLVNTIKSAITQNIRNHKLY